jgi:hypothetical protein
VPPSCPKLIFTPRPPRLEYLFITALLDARGVTAQARDQGSGVGKQGGGHPSTAAGSDPEDSPIHPDPSKWNCSSNARADRSGPSTECYDCLPRTRHGHRCPSLKHRRHGIRVVGSSARS